MKKFDNFCSALKNLNDIYNYNEPYENVVLTGHYYGMFEALKTEVESSWL